MFLFILAMAAAEVAVGLALVLRLYHRFQTLDADAASDDEGLRCSNSAAGSDPRAARSPASWSWRSSASRLPGRLVGR